MFWFRLCHIVSYRKTLYTSSFSKTRRVWPLKIFDIWWLYLMNLYQVYTIKPPGLKNDPAQWLLYFTKIHIAEKSVKIFLFDTRKHRPLIFSMYIHLIGLYRGCSDYSPGINNDQAKEVPCFTQTH